MANRRPDRPRTGTRDVERAGHRRHPENRILSTALDRMLHVPGVDPESRRMLRHLRPRFVDVTRLTPGTPPPAWRPTRLNARLRIALRLAELVLAVASTCDRDGVVRAVVHARYKAATVNADV